jgi:uncharacterized CHY-type Zn-finger protein
MKIGLYKNNKMAKVGDMIECPVCHTKFIKKQYSQAFCCLHCKDKFHNRHDGDRHKYDDISNDEGCSYDGADNDQWGDCELGIHD